MSEQINLNDDSFDSKEGGPIFNTGIAGLTENVTISLTKKKAEDKDKSPDYKIVYTDESGASVNTGLYYVTEDTQYKTIQEQIKAQGKVLKHLLHAVISPSFQFPPFSNAKEMLDGCMKALREGAKPGDKFRIFTNYGTTTSPKSFLQPRSWVPFIQPMGSTEDKLYVGTLDQMSRIAPDAKPGAGSAPTAPVEDGW